MRVLLTGAGGFLGSHCLRHILMNTDWKIVCPVTFRHKGLPERIWESVTDYSWWQRIDVINCDLATNINDTTASLFGDVDLIINYASDSHVDRSITDPVPFIRNNVDIVLNLLEYARQVKPQAFIQISTDEVYGPAPDGILHPEWAPIIPSNPYSASKAAQEAICVSYWRTYSVPVAIINSMNLIGETQDPEKFVPSTISKIFKGQEVTIHASPSGVIGSRFYLHARNLADAACFLINKGAFATYADGADRPDRWNVVGEREVDNLEMAKLLAALLDKPLNYHLEDFHSSRPGHDLRYALDGNKLEQAGWKLPIPFEESLERLVSWTLKRPLWLNRALVGEGTL